MQQTISSLQQAIENLQNGSKDGSNGGSKGGSNGGACSCNCAERVISALKSEIDSKISSISLSGKAQQVVETTMTGTLSAIAQVSVTGSGGSSSINFTY